MLNIYLGDMPIYGPAQAQLAKKLDLPKSSLWESLARLNDAGLLWIVRFSARRPLLYYAPGCALLRTQHAAYFGNVGMANSYGPHRRFKNAPRRITGNYTMLLTDDDSPVCMERDKDYPACDCLITLLDAINIDPEQFEPEELDPFDFGMYWADLPEFLSIHFHTSDILERLERITDKLPDWTALRAALSDFDVDAEYPDIIAPDES